MQTIAILGHALPVLLTKTQFMGYCSRCIIAGIECANFSGSIDCVGSNSWVKGVQESEDWCKENNLEYELVQNVPPGEFLQKLSSFKGLCFKPSGLDTCPRLVIEAKLLGCELSLNDNVQHTNEEWFNLDYEGIISYLKSRPAFFWEKAFD